MNTLTHHLILKPLESPRQLLFLYQKKLNKHFNACISSSSSYVYLLIFDSINLPCTEWSRFWKEPLSVLNTLTNQVVLSIQQSLTSWEYGYCQTLYEKVSVKKACILYPLTWIIFWAGSISLLCLIWSKNWNLDYRPESTVSKLMVFQRK